MVPVVTRAPNITNVHVAKLHPNHSCILIPEYFWITIYLYLVKQFKIESSDIFQIREYFQIFDVYFINRYLSVWGFTIVFPQVPFFLRIVRFFHWFVGSCTGTICHHKDITWQVLLWENLFHPEATYFTHEEDFSGKVQIPKWAPFAPNGTANQIAGKSWNYRGQYWTLNSMARKPWISHPNVG